jgi:hypothetical protein
VVAHSQADLGQWHIALSHEKKLPYIEGGVRVREAYSCGQAKSPNKNGSLVMLEKMPGKHSDALREAPG